MCARSEDDLKHICRPTESFQTPPGYNDFIPYSPIDSQSETSTWESDEEGIEFYSMYAHPRCESYHFSPNAEDFVACPDLSTDQSTNGNASQSDEATISTIHANTSEVQIVENTPIVSTELEDT